MQQIKEKLKDDVVAFYQVRGIGEVAARIGKSSQLLRDIRSGRSEITLDTLLAFSRGYPDEFAPILNLYFGSVPKQSPPDPVPCSDTQLAVAIKDALIVQQAATIEKLEHRVDVLELRNEIQAGQIVKLSDRPHHDSPGSDGHTTAAHHNQVFQAYHQAVQKAIGFDIPLSVPPGLPDLPERSDSPSAIAFTPCFVSGLGLIAQNGDLFVGPRDPN